MWGIRTRNRGGLRRMWCSSRNIGWSVGSRGFSGSPSCDTTGKAGTSTGICHAWLFGSALHRHTRRSGGRCQAQLSKSKMHSWWGLGVVIRGRLAGVRVFRWFTSITYMGDLSLSLFQKCTRVATFLVAISGSGTKNVATFGA